MKKKVIAKIKNIKAQIKNNVVIYQAKSGAIELRGDFSHETVWATQMQIAEAFDVNVRTINEHIQNILKTEELAEKATVRNFRIVKKEGKREVDRDVKHYNLDMILSVGYRVNSKKATIFRQWATKTLRNYIVDGFVVDKKRIAKNYTQFLNVVDDIKKLLPVGSAVDPKDAVELISLFADTWLSLDAYDRELLPTTKLTKKKVNFTAEKISKNLVELRDVLIEKGEATDVFGNERHKGSISGIVGNVMQSFGGQEVYPTVEEKAAHLLYFMVKNHPFTDGNKRSGAFAFVWFLKETKMLDIKRLTPSALTAITVLVAESDPNDKDKIIKLILNIISKK
ncbi:MAG: virulence protein RhuM/Fic/DOC family protein [Candidatus Nomurabacteria bacterium]